MNVDLNYYWRKIQEGDEKALEQLFKEVNNQLNYYAFQITRDLFTAEEIVQDVFLKIWQNRKDIRIKDSVKAYLYQSIHNSAINILIREKTQKHSWEKPATVELWNFIEATYDMDAFLLEKLEAEETGRIIDKAIHNLPQQCREIFSQSRFEGKSNKEIAQQFNISENTVKTQIYRALEKIKEALEKINK